MTTFEDFPTSCQGREHHVPTISPSGLAARRSHDSRDEDRRFMLRLPFTSRQTPSILAGLFEASQAEIMRQLMT